jgi:hypothetical protein
MLTMCTGVREGSPPAGKPEHVRPPFAGVACAVPLEAYCRKFPASKDDQRLCGPYGRALATIERWAAQLCADESSRAEIDAGTLYAEKASCGDYRVLAMRGIFGGDRAWFAADGTLVAVEGASDALASCDGGVSGYTIYGTRPDCAMGPSVSLCR